MFDWAVSLFGQAFAAVVGWFGRIMEAIDGYQALIGLFGATVVVGLLIVPIRGQALSDMARSTKGQGKSSNKEKGD